MKSWFAKYKETSSALEHSLRNPTPPIQAPDSLHASIMRAVRTSQAPKPQAPRRFSLSALAAPALALFLLVGSLTFFLYRQSVPHPNGSAPQPLASPTAALELADHLSQQTPSVLMAPLVDEWARLNQDLEKTAQFLLSSIP